VSDTPTETTVPETADTTTETTDTPRSTPDDAATGEDLDGLPEWARKKLTKANSEAARYRTSLREAEAKLAGAKTPEELDAAVADFQAQNAKLSRELAVSDLARKYSLPDDLAGGLRLAAAVDGVTPEELDAQAKVLGKYVTPEREIPAALSGGLDPTDDETFDPVKEAHAARRRRY
jgi:hypothetical protein